MIFFGNFNDFMNAMQNGNMEEYLNNLIKQSDPRIIRREAANVQDKINYIMEYLSWKGEEVYSLRFDIRPSVFLVFPKGIKSKKIYEKLFHSNLIDNKKQTDSIQLMVYPRYEKMYDILTTILMSH